MPWVLEGLAVYCTDLWRGHVMKRLRHLELKYVYLQNQNDLNYFDYAPQRPSERDQGRRQGPLEE
jgi:hypothetical protein